MEVIIKYNNQLRTVIEKNKSKFKYMKKTIEIFDDHSCKYTHVYEDHVSTKNYKLCKHYQKYRNLFDE